MNGNIQFTNELVLNAGTIREISLGLWNYRKGKNKMPVVLFLLALLSPAVYAFVTGNMDAIILVVPILLVGLVVLLVYLGCTAYQAAKAREKMIKRVIEEYGDASVLRLTFADQIHYTFGEEKGTVQFDDVKNIIESDLYLIFVLNNGIELPLWKFGFTEGNWDDFVLFLRENKKSKVSNAPDW